MNQEIKREIKVVPILRIRNRINGIRVYIVTANGTRRRKDTLCNDPFVAAAALDSLVSNLISSPTS